MPDFFEIIALESFLVGEATLRSHRLTRPAGRDL